MLIVMFVFYGIDGVHSCVTTKIHKKNNRKKGDWLKLGFAEEVMFEVKPAPSSLQ